MKSLFTLRFDLERPTDGDETSTRDALLVFVATPELDPVAFASTIEAEIMVVEPLGKNIDVSCELRGGEPMLARIDARHDFPTSGSMRFFVDMEHVHLFEPGEFGASLLYPGGAPVDHDYSTDRVINERLALPPSSD